MDPEIVVDTELEQAVETETPQVDDSDAEARAAYDRAKSARATSTKTPAPAIEAKTETGREQVLPADSPPQETAAEPEPAPVPQETNASAAPAPQDRIAELSGVLKGLQSEVKELSKGGTTATEIRKLQGEIGSINRTLKQLSKSDDAPADLAAALAQAEKVADEFPEIARPIVNAIKAMQSAANAVQQPEPEISFAPQVDPQEAERQRTQARDEARREAAIESLKEIHSDFWDMKKTPQFQAWYAKQPPERRSKVESTWNPAVLAKLADDYKATLRRKVDNQQRLDAAVTPQGTTGNPRPTAPSDEELARQAYQRYRSKRI